MSSAPRVWIVLLGAAVCTAWALNGCKNDTTDTLSTSTAIRAPAPEPRAQARVATDEFLRGIQIIELAEGQAAVAAYSWGGEFSALKIRELPQIRSIADLYENTFETDRPDVLGYRRLMQIEIVSKGQTRRDELLGKAGVPEGATFTEKYTIVAFKDLRSDRWRVLTFDPSFDEEENLQLARGWAERDSPRKDPRYERTSLAWLLLRAGKFAEAKLEAEAALATPQGSLGDPEFRRNASDAFKAESDQIDARYNARITQRLEQFSPVLAAIVGS